LNSTLVKSLASHRSSYGLPEMSEVLRRALEKLETLLVAGDLEAMNALAEIDHLYLPAANPTLESLIEAMTDMNFEAALNCCRALLVSSSDGRNTMQPRGFGIAVDGHLSNGLPKGVST
jgi:hypothetical protein